MTHNPFVPPAAEGLPLAALGSATAGASALDAWARTLQGRNFLAHALVQLARDGWLRPEAGEGFEPEEPPSVPSAVDRAELRDLIAEVLWPLTDWDGDQSNAERAADAVFAVLPPPADRAALDRVRALHLPKPDGSGFPDGMQCRTCSHDGGDGYQYLVPWPCPTVEAVNDELRRMADEAQQPEPDDTDLTETDIDRMMAAGVPVQIVTAPPNTHAVEAQQPVSGPWRCESREPLDGAQCRKEAGHEAHSDRPGRIWYPLPAAEAQQQAAHSCGNCEGIDPDTCLMNPDRPAEHAPGCAILCPDCRAKGRSVCVPDAVASGPGAADNDHREETDRG